jgi:BirA family biotin operon repressor/biotin-[acetyl-CoA-carboxylase] ligase
MISTKYKVLYELQKQNEYISGQSLADSLGISRAAINKAVSSLRQENYDITATRNLGYMLNNSPDRLNPGELLHFLDEKRIETISCHSSVVSTNVCLHEAAELGAGTGYVVLAEEQTSGRGKNGSIYDSPSGGGVYMSYLFANENGRNFIKPSTITPMVTDAICQVLSQIFKTGAAIRNPGDIYIGDQKICGTMTEVLMEAETGFVRYSISGIGVQPFSLGYRTLIASRIILALDDLVKELL